MAESLEAVGAQGRVVATTCPYCGVGCGVLAHVADDGVVSVRGDPDHPANAGRLCSKGSALADTVEVRGRLLQPSIHGETVGWDAALDHVVREFARIRAHYGPDSVAFYVSGQLLTEDYYVANKLMKGFIGSGNIDTNSRLCMASTVAGHQRAFGADAVPGCYEDWELADLVVLVGSNTAWCHPVLYQRLTRAKEARPELQVVVIDPRRTATCDLADLHLPLRPGSDVALFDGLLDYLRRHDCLDFDFLERCTEGLGGALAAARRSAPSLPHVAQACGVDEESIAEFYRLFARTEKVVTVFSQGVNQSSSGTAKVNSIINCHLATGRIGRPGQGPFSVTGQPNAMGGREVGGMANQLAAHMRFDDPDDVERVGRFWRAKRMAQAPGLKAVDLFNAVGEGKVRALWIMATNPAVSLPDSDRVRDALARCEFVVVSDCVQTDTAAYAHVLLPAATWAEKDGTVTNSERRISRQRPFLQPPGEARPDWWIITQVARRLGHAEQFSYRTPADIFREHARLSGFENDGRRAFDIGMLSTVTEQEYNDMDPVQWPVTAAFPRGTPRLFTDGRFYTRSGRARLLATESRDPENATGVAYPLVLNTGRVRDQWHTMTRTGRSPRLSAHKAEPYVEIHPSDAEAYHLADGGIARLTTAWGSMLARIALSRGQRPGSLFVPMHWSAQNSAAGRVDALVNPALDPVSGQPELKHTPVAIEPYPARWHAFVYTRAGLDTSGIEYWVRVQERGFERYEIAGVEPPPDWGAWTRRLLGGDAEGWLDFADGAAGRYRTALIVEERLEACVFVGPDAGLGGREWVAQLFASGRLTDAQRMRLLAGTPGGGTTAAGRTVCACFGIGERVIRDAILGDGLTKVEEIGRRLKAGTNCGSCIPELKALLAANAR